jgi:NAD(P)-dependent dehydrogenase (short-subunit alcohol dehydrogenase family)
MTTPQEYFSNKVIFITGAASGIGREFALQLSNLGARLILTDIQGTVLELSDEIRAEGGTAEGHILDVTNYSDFNKLINSTKTKFGTLDILFNNAGIGISGDAVNFKIDDWNKLISVNISGVINGCESAYAIMRGQQEGHIINTASVAGIVSTPGMAGYSATKHAVLGLTKSLRIEAQEFGVTFSTLCPGAIDTPILSGGEFGGAIGYKLEGMKKITDTWQPISATPFVEKSLIKIAKKKGIIIVPRKYRITVWILTRLPNRVQEFIHKKIHNINQKMLEPFKIPVD